jgi:hypothetical protein
MWKRLLGGGLLLRTIAQELRGIRLQLTRQTDLLERWATQAGLVSAQQLPTHTPGHDLVDTGISFLDGIEAGLVQDYIDRTQVAIGRAPTDDEILAHLADEKTVNLHQRLKEREALLQLERLGR